MDLDSWWWMMCNNSIGGLHICVYLNGCRVKFIFCPHVYCLQTLSSTWVDILKPRGFKHEFTHRLNNITYNWEIKRLFNTCIHLYTRMHARTHARMYAHTQSYTHKLRIQQQWFIYAKYIFIPEFWPRLTLFSVFLLTMNTIEH